LRVGLILYFIVIDVVLWSKDNLARGFSAFKCSMGFLSFGQREEMFDP
jgi:hypothetical protein